MSNGYAHWGVPQTGTWGAMTAPVGARTDRAVQMARSAIAGLGNLLTPFEWTAAPPARMEERARARG
jgi:hypothetical protein